MSDRGERRRRTECVVRRRRRDRDRILAYWPFGPDGKMRKTAPMTCPDGRTCPVCNPERGTPTLQERRVDADEVDE